jgi:acyl-ACP thioesterase
MIHSSSYHVLMDDQTERVHQILEESAMEYQGTRDKNPRRICYHVLMDGQPV